MKIKDQIRSKARELINGGGELFVATAIILFVLWIAIIIFTDPINITSLVTSNQPSADDFTISWAALWFLASVAYIIFSFRWYKDEMGNEGYVAANEIGVRQIFGYPTDVISAGLPFVPLKIFQLQKLTISVQQKEFPGEPGEVASGEKEPVRITFRNSVTDKEAQVLLGDEYDIVDGKGNTLTFKAEAPKDGLAKRVTAELVPVVRWKIKKEEAIAFITNIGSIDEANRQIEDEMFSVLLRLLPNMSVGQAKQNFRWINAILMEAVIKRTINWGIDIEGAFIKMIPLHHDLNSAIALAAEAEFTGRGERELIEQRGAGEAKAAGDRERKTLMGRTEGLKKLAEALGIKGEEAIAQFVAGQIASGPGTIILGEGGLNQIAGIGAALLNKSNSTKSVEGTEENK